MVTKSTHFIDSQVSNDWSVTDSLNEQAKVFVADGVSHRMGQTTALQGQTSPDHGAALVPGANRASLGTWDTGELLSESLFVALFETMSEGMALHEMVVGADAIATDYRIINVNPAFESQTGLARELVVGKLATQAYGVTPPPFLEMYGRVARTGRPIKFEQYFEPLKRHFLIQVFSPGYDQFATVFTDITARFSLEQTLRESKSLVTSLVDSLTEHVAVVDAHGMIVSVNASWRRFAKENGATHSAADSIGANYLDVCADACATAEDEGGASAMNGILSVLTGASADFTMRYPCHSPTQERWFELHAVPLLGSAGGAVLIHRDISDRKRAQRAIAEQKTVVELILEQSLAGYWDWRIQKNEEYLSPTFKKMFGYEDHEMPNTPAAWQKIIFPEDLPGVFEVFDRHVQSRGEVPFYNEVRYRHKDGSTVWVICTGRIVEWDDQGQPVRMIGFHIDQTKIRQEQQKIQLGASVFTHAREGITITDAAGSILDVNEAFTRITGYSRAEVIGQNPRILKSGRQDSSFYAVMWDALTAQGHWSGEIWNRRKDGEVYAEMLTISSVKDAAGTVQHYLALFSDITALKAHQSQLEHIAHFDTLTNLPNRLLLADRLQQALVQAQRRGQQLAVAYLDLDGFKAINDHHGHEVGDQVLIALASHMKDCLREGDTLARLGGDEFVAVLFDLKDTSDSAPLLDRLLAAAAMAVPVDKLMLQVSASLGVTFYPQAHDIQADQLLRQADHAMYQAKLAGKNRYHVFDAALDSSIRVQHESLQRIRLALQRREFVLHYQPKVSMYSGTVVGAEALIRWQHPERGLLAPSTFLPVIEDHPLAVDVGEWVIDAAFHQMETWQAAGLDLSVSVNIGARQLQQTDFVARLQAILARHPQVRPGCIELEILETSALADIAQVSQVIEDCAKLGVTFALDDFGTGYSSLTYLKQLRVGLLKIDQSFVRGMLKDTDDLAILQGVIGLAGAFKRDVIAEGVETVAHGSALLQLGCELAQGYGIARPMPAEQMPNWVSTWKPDAAWGVLLNSGNR